MRKQNTMIHRKPPEYVNDATQKPGVAVSVLGWIIALAVVFIIIAVLWI